MGSINNHQTFQFARVGSKRTISELMSQGTSEANSTEPLRQELSSIVTH